ncbi:MAG: FHA domain-containing protein [Actinobacteria bacterium]|nr:FHA domain-containing protein [Actinomycetota bacterium]
MSACPKCGFKNIEEANFCSHCGMRLVVQEIADTTAVYDTGEALDLDSTLETAQADMVTPALVIRAGGGREGEEIALDGELLTIGRNPDNDLFLDDITVSRHHCRVVRDAYGYTIEDLNSLNGTYVNRRRVERQHLHDGDEVQIGKFKLGFFEPEVSM